MISEELFNRPHKMLDAVRTIATRNDLSEITNPVTQLVIWERSLPQYLRAWLEQLRPSQLPKLRVLVEPSELRHAIEPHFKHCNIGPREMNNLLIDDIEELVFTYASITKKDLVDVRLERVNNNACWKFHRDFVDTRLVTTYRGRTTEWVQPAHAAQALREQKRFQGPLEDIALHNVAIFKGSDSSTRSDSGIVHRSPPISGTGCTRLLLCLNEQSPASPDPWSTGHP